MSMFATEHITDVCVLRDISGEIWLDTLDHAVFAISVVDADVLLIQCRLYITRILFH